MLLDSNIIIYATQPHHDELRQFIASVSPVVSTISYVEVLGYHLLSEADKSLLEAFFQATDVLPINDAVVQKAVELRQKKRMSLGDSLIAGTTIAFDLTLITHNIQDFEWIPELKLIDPLTR